MFHYKEGIIRLTHGYYHSFMYRRTKPLPGGFGFAYQGKKNIPKTDPVSCVFIILK